MPMSMQNKTSVSTEVEQGAEIDATATFNALHSSKRYANTGKYSNCDNINAVDELEVLQSVDLIRTLPRTLREKRQAKYNLQTIPRKKATEVDKLKVSQAKTSKRLRSHFHESFSIGLWHGSFKRIEDQFGPAVASYFKFIKWLFYINIFIFLCLLAVVILPQKLMDPDTFGQTVDIDNFTDGRFTAAYATAVNCSQQYSEHVVGITQSNWQYAIIDFLQGTGWMENSVLFQGFYFNKTFYFDDSISVHYNMPVALLLITASYFTIAVIVMVRRSAVSIKESIVRGREAELCVLSERVFCGWEFSICSDKTARLRHKMLYKDFLLDVKAAREQLEAKVKDCAEMCKVVMARIIVSIVMIVILAASLVLIGFVAAVWMPELLLRENVSQSPILTLIVQFLPSITIALLNVIVPVIFLRLVTYLKTLPDNEVKVMIVSTVLLRLASVFVLIITIFVSITRCDQKTCANCQPKVYCWETYAGQQFYKLVVLDFILVVAITLLLEFPRRFVVRRLKAHSSLIRAVGYQEFDLATNVLAIVYTQTISWIGGFFCPLLAGVTAFKLFIFFYVKKWSLLVNCEPSPKVYKTSKIDAFFMRILLIFFAVVVFLPLAFAIGRIPPSQGCGPFRVYSQSTFVMYTVIQDGIGTLPSVLSGILHYLGSWLFFIPAWIFLIIIINFFVAKAAGHKRTIDLLRQQYLETSQDNQKLARMNKEKRDQSHAAAH